MQTRTYETRSEEYMGGTIMYMVEIISPAPVPSAIMFSPAPSELIDTRDAYVAPNNPAQLSPCTVPYIAGDGHRTIIIPRPTTSRTVNPSKRAYVLSFLASGPVPKGFRRSTWGVKLPRTTAPLDTPRPAPKRSRSRVESPTIQARA
jgi:hypothetical protein